MPRFRHIESGAFVNVSDEKAARLGSGWESADGEKKAQAKRPARKASAKSDES